MPQSNLPTAVLINADFSQRALITPNCYQWVASPQAGVERVMLDRIGAEKARATSIVRYSPDSYFPPHQHPGGEEILVLSGTFSDEHGDYPAGWYLRNPPGTSHQPFSREGATIFVKLWQMPPGETRQIRVDTRDPANWKNENGRATCFLFSDGIEHVSIERLEPGKPLVEKFTNGAEMLVLEGALIEAATQYPQGTWLRVPAGESLDFAAGASGVTVFLKTGHIAKAALNPQLPFAV